MKNVSELNMQPEWLALFRKAARIVKFVPEVPGRVLRCHEVARAVHLLLREEHERLVARARDPEVRLAKARKRFRVVDGTFNENMAHSWIEIEPDVLIDVYCVEMLPQVQLRDQRRQVAKSYVETPLWKRGPGRHADKKPDLKFAKKLAALTKKAMASARTLSRR